VAPGAGQRQPAAGRSREQRVDLADELPGQDRALDPELGRQAAVLLGEAHIEDAQLLDGRLNAARDQAIPAAGVPAGPAADPAGTIGRLVPASLTPGRRLRISPRVVKRAMARHNAKGKVDRATRTATIAITIPGVPLTPDDEP
jgi:hypothetical protein